MEYPDELDVADWNEFPSMHRGGHGEQALVTVGSIVNQIGTLTHEGLLPTPHLLLRSVGRSAIAVWNKFSPPVELAREYGISALFWNSEWQVATAYRAYKPAHPLSHDQTYVASLERLAG